MSQNKRHLQAFTIVELLVGMTLTSILVTASMYAFQLIQKQYVLQSEMQIQLDSRINFKTRLLLDIETTVTIRREDKKLLLTNQWQNIQYQFEPTVIVRTNSLSKIAPDTFWVAAQITKTNFQQQEIFEGWIDNCELTIDLFGEAELWQFQKKYSAQELYDITQNTNHHEH